MSWNSHRIIGKPQKNRGGHKYVDLLFQLEMWVNLILTEVFVLSNFMWLIVITAFTTWS